MARRSSHPGAELATLYRNWWTLLSMDYARSAGLSVMGWLQSWFHLNPPKTFVALVGKHAPKPK